MMTAHTRIRVSRIDEVASEIKRFELVSADGLRLPTFSPGSHVVVTMRQGERVWRNPYSIMGATEDRRGYVISVRCSPGSRGGSAYMHTQVRVGSELEISGPVNLFSVSDAACKHFMIAGGIGITPMLAMLDQFKKNGADFELHYAIRTLESGAYHRDLAGESDSRITIYRSDRGERIPLADLLGNQPPGTHLYVCGPQRMVDWALELAEREGWPPESVHWERFHQTNRPLPIDDSFPGDAPAHAGRQRTAPQMEKLQTMSQRNSVLNDRHRALGSDLSSSWNDMPVPQSYGACPYAETETVRNRAGLFDVSALKIVNVNGPDAAAFLNRILTTDVTKAKAGDSHISNIVDERGALIDDVLVYIDGGGKYRVSHGGGSFEEAAAAAKRGFDVTVERDDDVHILSLQGPLALDTLAPHTTIALAELPYFQHQKATLFGRSVTITRGGYSAERGYEVFCSAKDAPFIWDSILEAGKDKGITAVSWSCLDIIRVEGGLLFFPFDMPYPDTTPWEMRADWTVDLSKPDFIGKQALIDRKGKERSFITGLEVTHHDALPSSSKVYADGREVGVLTSTTFSRHLMKSLAMAHIASTHTKLGTQLVVRDGNDDYRATVVQMPFFDPMRLKTHPVT